PSLCLRCWPMACSSSWPASCPKRAAARCSNERCRNQAESRTEELMARRWKQRPEGSNWGEFGDEDQLGRLNLLTPQKVLEAVAEVRAGQAFSLSLPLDLPGGNVLNPARHPPRLTATRRDDKPVFLHSFAHDHNTTDV